MAPPVKVTDEQIIDALRASDGNIRAAARSLGVDAKCIHARKPRLALKGWAPEHGLRHTVPDGFSVKGVSTLYDETGALRLQWVKSNQDAEAVQRRLDGYAAALAQHVTPVRAIKPPAACNADLLNLYVITDYHLGMLSWPEETGDDWNTDLAEAMLLRWFGAAIAQSPAAEHAVFAQLGDFLHWDGMDAVTPASKHLLDADTRFQKIVRVAIRVLRQVIAMLLARHQRVTVLMCEGNHDPASSIWLRELFRALYEAEPRIDVVLSPDPYYCVEHGETSLFFHHGHKVRLSEIAPVFAAKFRAVFGRTKHSYAHMGHLHHVDVKENNLMLVEQHRTLAGSDAYASRGGWLSGRDAQVITYSARFGEVGRVRVSSRMLEAA